ncbi:MULTISPECIES: SulP family inorganic anion transporter [unclassified Microbacterium]|uniref:SulP family inorganic anion transporter n=1 Tax=unclassified Microbacterium TaxID=2609290 RepID=UPI0021A5F891|nr:MULTISPECIES: SulP family inorganic anion transporter [unclassified Microbacterium]MCT1364919.1 SulP family inorganic anion transporter [Microbacterium sp. p3-SID131]MCT1378373.1 SulP family inorganic anion transporter [Microbacterium sp. p3-SID337]
MSAVRRPSWLLSTLDGYQRQWIVRDVLAGLSAGAVVVPQAMAYATIADLPVQVGLYTCIVPMLVYALLGGSRAMSVSTTSTIATLTATTLVSAGVAAGSDDALGALMMLTLLVGAVLLLARACRLGSLVENISGATVLGLKIGVGATVAVGQLPKLLGESFDFSGHGFLRSLVAVGGAFDSVNVPTLLLSTGSIATLLLLKRFAPRVPGTLVVVAAGMLLVGVGGIDELGVDLIAPVAGGLPVPGIPDLSEAAALVPGALAIAVMAFLESAAVARSLRQATEPQIDSDQELFATGAANTVGAFFAAMPAAGGFSQSAVNQGAGARSQLATLTTVALAVLVALFLAPVLSLLPEATLAAMVFTAVAGLINIPELVRWARISRVDFWVATAVASIGLTAGLLPAVAVGVVVTLVLVLRELNIPRVRVVGRRGSALGLEPERGLYTANALANQRLIVQTVAAQAEPVRTLVLGLPQQVVMSITVLDTLEALDRELAQLGVQLDLAALPEEASVVAARTPWYAGLVEAGRVHPAVDVGLRAAADREERGGVHPGEVPDER